MKLPEKLTLNEAVAALAELRAAAAQTAGQRLLVDASVLKVFDSAALAVLLEARRLADADGVAFQLCGADRRLAQLAGLYGVADLLGLPSEAPEPSAR